MSGQYPRLPTPVDPLDDVAKETNPNGWACGGLREEVVRPSSPHPACRLGKSVKM